MKRRTRIAVHVEERLVIRTGLPDSKAAHKARPPLDRLRDGLRSLFEHYKKKDKTTCNEK